MRPTPTSRFRLVAVGFVAVCAACGPFGSLKRISRDANRAVARAEKSGAEQYAPYEFWGAKAYLEQAKILMGYSEYERAFDYGDRAKQLAEEAERKAKRVESGQSTERIDGLAAPDEVPTDDKPLAGDAGNAAESTGATSAEGEAPTVDVPLDASDPNSGGDTDAQETTGKRAKDQGGRGKGAKKKGGSQ